MKISRDNVVMQTDIMTGIVKAGGLTVRACLGYLKLVFRGQRTSWGHYYVYDFVFDFTDIFNYCGRAGGDRRFSAQGLV